MRIYLLKYKLFLSLLSIRQKIWLNIQNEYWRKELHASFGLVYGSFV